MSLFPISCQKFKVSLPFLLLDARLDFIYLLVQRIRFYPLLLSVFLMILSRADLMLFETQLYPPPLATVLSPFPSSAHTRKFCSSPCGWTSGERLHPFFTPDLVPFCKLRQFKSPKPPYAFFSVWCSTFLSQPQSQTRYTVLFPVMNCIG